MELELARKLEEMSFQEIVSIMKKFMMEDREAFLALKEIVDDQL